MFDKNENKKIRKARENKKAAKTNFNFIWFTRMYVQCT